MKVHSVIGGTVVLPMIVTILSMAQMVSVAYSFHLVNIPSISLLSQCSTSLRNTRLLSTSPQQQHQGTNEQKEEEEDLTAALLSRRSLLVGGVSSAFFSSLLVLPSPAKAAIDVSGLRVEGGTGVSGAPAIKEQLRSYDGSGAARVQSIQSGNLATPTSSSSTTTTTATTTSSKQSIVAEEISSAATYAYRYAPGISPRLSKLGFGERYQCEDRLVSPTTGKALSVQFEFPSDWLQLDRMLGGIQYVDQRNGDKLYILKAKLPNDTTVTTVPKQWFGESLFDPQGTIAKGGVEVDEYKVTKSTILNEGILSTPHRRLVVKYVTVTPNGLRTERRGLIDAYDVDGIAYMMFTGSNAVKFEKNGIERETVESIVNSFRIE